MEQQLFDQYGTPLKVGQEVAVARQHHIVKGKITEIVSGNANARVYIHTTYPAGTEHPVISYHYRYDGDHPSKKYMSEILVLGE